MVELAQRVGILDRKTHRNLAGAAFRSARAGHCRRGYATNAVSLECVHEPRVHVSPLDAADRAAILDLDARSVRRGATPLPDLVRAELTSTPRHGTSAVVSADDSGALRGAAVAAPANDGAQIAVVDDGEDSDLRSALLAALLRGIDALPATWWTAGSEEDQQAAVTLGMRPGRRLLHMVAALPFDLPAATVATRPFRPGEDDAEWLIVNNAAFSGHPEQGGWTQATLDQRLAEPWFCADGFLLHHRDGVLVGFCWVKMHTDGDTAVGEIYVVGVRPEAQGLGLGKALTAAGLRWMEHHGAASAMLFVDGANTPAIRVYESLGFRVDSAQQAFTYQREDPA
jgi:mycothiol synthase